MSEHNENETVVVITEAEAVAYDDAEWGRVEMIEAQYTRQGF